MTALLLVDDSAYSAEMFVEIVRDRLGWSVTVSTRAGDVTDEFLAGAAFDLAVVDLSFPQESLTGLDVLVTIHRAAPTVALVILTQGDAVSGDVLRDAWEALPLAGIISKITPVNRQIELLRSVVRDGQVPPDPVLQAWLPAERSPWRRADQYHRLVKHAGHAKLWRSLIDAPHEPSYGDLSHATGLKLNTLKNYRADIVDDLALHGLDDPTIKQMYQFARRTRPLLEPFIEQCLSGARPRLTRPMGERTPAGWRGRAAFAIAVIGGVAGIVAVGNPTGVGPVRDGAPIPGPAPTTQPGVLDGARLTAWCRERRPGDVAVLIGEGWRCARIENGFFRHDPIGDTPCHEEFTRVATVESSAEGLRCLA